MGLRGDLELEVGKIYREAWTRRDGRKVPEDADVSYANDAVDITAVVLYADLCQSTKLVDNYDASFAAENYKTFLRCATKIIKSEGGEIRSFDGDRVMGIFFGDGRAERGVRCGLKIHWAVISLIQPEMKKIYANTNYVMKHIVGIDLSKIMVVKAGVRGANDLVWVGKAPNHAAKMTAEKEFPTWLSGDVYDEMPDSVKYASGTNMWQKRQWASQGNRRIYGSTYYWELT